MLMYSASGLVATAKQHAVVYPLQTPLMLYCLNIFICDTNVLEKGCI